MLRVIAVVAGLAFALPAIGGEMTASDARHFVTGKLFSYACFDGTRGLARVNPDGSVDGSIQPKGRGPTLWHNAGCHPAGEGRASLCVVGEFDYPTLLLPGPHQCREFPRLDIGIKLRLLRFHPLHWPRTLRAKSTPAEAIVANCRQITAQHRLSLTK